MFLLYLFSYVSAIVFAAAALARGIRIATAPMHLRWELYPVAHEGKRTAWGGSYLEDYEWWKKQREKNLLGELTVMIPEIFLLKGLWEYNRKMWFPSFCLHHGIYWLAGMAALLLVRVIFAVPQLMPLIALMGVVGYSVGSVGAAYLIILRATDRKMRNYSSFGTFFNLFLLLAIFITGFLSFLNGEHFAGMSGFFRSLVVFRFAPLTAPVILHVALAVLFVLYLPFTHMTHFFTKYFTYHSVRWNDEPNLKGGKLQKQIEKVLKYPVSWSAKHIGADGKKTWAEIATSEVPKDDK